MNTRRRLYIFGFTRVLNGSYQNRIRLFISPNAKVAIDGAVIGRLMRFKNIWKSSSLKLADKLGIYYLNVKPTLRWTWSLQKLVKRRNEIFLQLMEVYGCRLMKSEGDMYSLEGAELDREIFPLIHLPDFTTECFSAFPNILFMVN